MNFFTFFFSKYFNSIIKFLDKEINNIPGDLSDISARTATIVRVSQKNCINIIFNILYILYLILYLIFDITGVPP